MRRVCINQCVLSANFVLGLAWGCDVSKHNRQLGAEDIPSAHLSTPTTATSRLAKPIWFSSKWHHSETIPTTEWYIRHPEHFFIHLLPCSGRSVIKPHGTCREVIQAVVTKRQLTDWWDSFDSRYMRPYFSKPEVESPKAGGGKLPAFLLPMVERHFLRSSAVTVDKRVHCFDCFCYAEQWLGEMLKQIKPWASCCLAFFLTWSAHMSYGDADPHHPDLCGRALSNLWKVLTNLQWGQLIGDYLSTI